MALCSRQSCLLFALLAIGLLACSSTSGLVSPSNAGASTGQVGSAQTVGLTGLVSGLNPDARTFSLAVRGGTRLIVADAGTTVWSQASDSQVRFSALKDGQVVSIRGIDQTRFILAQSIVITG